MGDAIKCALRGAVEVRGWHNKGALCAPFGGITGQRWAMVVSHEWLEALHVEPRIAIQLTWLSRNQPSRSGVRRLESIAVRREIPEGDELGG